jgi:hypothetical protein
MINNPLSTLKPSELCATLSNLHFTSSLAPVYSELDLQTPDIACSESLGTFKESVKFRDPV